MVRRFDWFQALMPASSGAPLVKMKAPRWVAVLGDPSETVDSARAVAHRRGGKLHMAARVSTIVVQNSP
jgi:hypothetical protein